MALLADGLSNKEIGYRLHRSDLTIRNKISRMYTKAGLYGEGSRIKLIRLHYDLKEKA